MGKVYLVGAGPGDPELITVKGQRLLQECDCLVYDRLAGEALINLAKPSCEKIFVGKQPGRHYRKQEEINQILAECARRHEITVRLKGGDPFVFGRGGEEAEVLAEEGIAYEVIPGVSSAIAVPECAGIPVTHRGIARSFHVITGHTMEHGGMSGIDFRSLAEQEGTLIFLMGLSHLEGIIKKLLTYGKTPDMPAAVISDGTTPAQREVRGTLQTIAEQVQSAGLHSPAVIVVGETAGLRYQDRSAINERVRYQEGLAGESERFFVDSLMGTDIGAGRTVGVTATASLFSRLEAELGEKKIYARLVCEMRVIPQKEGMAQLEGIFCRDGLSAYTWIVFTSQNSVRVFFDKFQKEKGDMTVFSKMKFAVLGSGTEQILRYYLIGIKEDTGSDFIPSAYTVHDFCREFAGMLTGQDRILVPRARQGSKELIDMLEQSPAEYTYVETYDVEGHMTDQMAYLDEMSCLVFASASGAEAFMRELESGGDGLSRWKGQPDTGTMTEPEQNGHGLRTTQRIVCIGKVTEQKLQEHGIWADAVASVHTAEGLVSVVEELLTRAGEDT